MSDRMKEFIEALRWHHGAVDSKGKLVRASLREIGRIYGITRPTLTNWCRGSGEYSNRCNFIESGRKALQWSETKTYKKVIKLK